MRGGLRVRHALRRSVRDERAASPPARRDRRARLAVHTPRRAAGLGRGDDDARAPALAACVCAFRRRDGRSLVAAHRRRPVHDSLVSRSRCSRDPARRRFSSTSGPRGASCSRRRRAATGRAAWGCGRLRCSSRRCCSSSASCATSFPRRRRCRAYCSTRRSFRHSCARRTWRCCGRPAPTFRSSRSRFVRRRHGPSSTGASSSCPLRATCR